jgi:glycosyltransferase involved in cell wall biosynthesis
LSIQTKIPVSVYIPTRNRSDFLQRAITSALKQTWQNIEIIVVDDASDDQTQDILGKLGDVHPIRIIRNDRPKGAAACRNIAIEHATSDFVAGLDDDDVWLPERIEFLMNAFVGGYSAVCSHDKMDYGQRKITWKKKPLITYDDLLYYNRVGNQVLTRKEYILAVGGYDESLTSAQDYDLWIRMAEKFGPVKNVPLVLQIVNVKQTRNSITTSDKKAAGYIACYEKHKSKMNQEQKKYHEYRIRLALDEKVTWREMFSSVPFRLLKKELTRKLFL